MDIETSAKQDLIDSILKIMVTPNIKPDKHSADDDIKYDEFLRKVRLGHQASTQLALDYALKHDMFELIKSEKIFIENSVKFVTSFTTKRPNTSPNNSFNAKYIGNEFFYSFLDNHPGIINVDKLKDIPVDYEGLMAVPTTVLEYRNIMRFNIHRVLYTPKHFGKIIYPRIVVSNKFTTSI